jgi:predicted RNA-binding Zn-ribbon protein involved in translation (DUF1610 family)
MRRIICPNCGYEVRPKREARGSLQTGLIAIILLILEFFISGIFYLVLLGKYRYRCPECGMKIAADNRNHACLLKTWVAQKRDP